MVSNSPIRSHSPGQIPGLVEASTMDVIVILTKNYNCFNNILFFSLIFDSLYMHLLVGKSVTMLKGGWHLSHGDLESTVVVAMYENNFTIQTT